MSSVPVYLLSSVCKKNSPGTVEAQVYFNRESFHRLAAGNPAIKREFNQLFLLSKSIFCVCSTNGSAAARSISSVMRFHDHFLLAHAAARLSTVAKIYHRARSVCGRAGREFIFLVLVCILTVRLSFSRILLCHYVLSYTLRGSNSLQTREITNKKKYNKGSFFALSF